MYKTRVLIFGWVVFFFSGALLLEAQSPMPLEEISIENGLSQSYVFNILEDQDGFLWFCTDNGLNRYDGYEFKVYKHNPYDPFSIDNSRILGIVEAGEWMFVLTGNGLNLFDLKTQRFYPFNQTFEGPGQKFSKMYAPDAHTLVLATPAADQHQIVRLTWPEDLKKQLQKGADPDQLIKKEVLYQSPLISSLVVLKDQKTLYALLPEFLLKTDLTTGRQQEFPLPAWANILADPTLQSDGVSGCWINGEGHFAFFDGTAWITYDAPSTCKILQADAPTGVLWVKNTDQVYGFDLHHLPQVFNPEKAIYHLFIPEITRYAFTDRYSNVWFGTDARGLKKFTPRNSVFRNYLAGASLYSPPVTDNTGNIWLAEVRRSTVRKGRLKTGQQTLEPLQALGIAFSENTTRIARDPSGVLWMTGADPTDQHLQLVRFDPPSGQKSIFQFPDTIKGLPRVVIYGAPGTLWMANDDQLIQFHTGTQTWSVTAKPPHAAGQETYSLALSPGGICWLGERKGLLKATPHNNSFDFEVWLNNPKDPNSLPGNEIKSLLTDPNDPNLLWIGSAGGGLSRLTISTRQFKNYTVADGLPDDVIYGILPENREPGQPTVLWLSSNRGLARFVPQDQYFQYYFKSDGLQDNEFNTFAYGQSANGELMFGGVNGLTVFDPKKLKTNTIQPHIKITGLKINGSWVNPGDSLGVLTTAIEFTPEIALSYSRNNLLIQFAALDLTQPRRNQFEYYLEGMEKPWAHKGFEHSAQYLSLPPGDYTFWVKGSNSDGIWSEQPVSLKIMISPPWYASWWAWLCYAAAIAGMVYALYNYQLKRKLEHNETLRLKELDAFKSRFFTNVSHEFRTPLTVILGTIEQLLGNATQIKEKLQLVRRNSESLLRLVNQILDLAKLENNVLKINYIQGDILAYLRYVAESLHSLANTRNVLVRVESSEAQIMMDYDPERIQAIVHNLLSNAVKFTGSGGRVILKAEITDQSASPALQIAVTDTGAGIPAEDIPFLFDRFFQAKNQEHAAISTAGKSGVGPGGTGIGLSLTKELVKAMGGRIAVDSAVGRGSTFTVWLPIRNAAAAMDVVPVYHPDASAAVPRSSGITPKYQKTTHHLLIIEDNPDVLEYLVSCLGDDFRLDFAYNGRAGIEKALEIIPDLIISDVMMPEKDGYEVCAALKNDESTSHVPIILLTAKAGMESKLTGLKSGADAYLAKPFHPEELRITLDNLILQRRKLQDRYAAGVAAPVTAGNPEPPEDVFVQKVRDAINSRLDDATLSGEELCRMLGMSYPVVYRKLSALTGRSLHLFIRLVRLQKARELLLRPELTIAEIAYQTGFNDPKYFSRVFSEEYQISPTAFRQNIDS